MRERVKQWRQKVTSFLEKHIKPQSIQMTIALSFTIVSVISMGILGISLYNRFVNKMEDMTTQSAEQLLNQTAINLESYLRNMRRISDAMYYSVIKDKDLATDSLDEEMNLLYEANKDNLISIACYTNDGRLVAAAPVATEKNNLDIVDQEWFTEATGQMENVHFSTPHVQNLFDDPSYRYYWVVSLSQAVICQIVDERLPGLFLEHRGKIGGAHIEVSADRLNSKVGIRIMLFHIVDCLRHKGLRRILALVLHLFL